MKIPNPFPRYTVRAICKPGDLVVVQCSRHELELPDGTTEALIDPIKDLGRGKYEPLCQAKIWSERWGQLELKDHAKKMEIEEEGRKLEEAKKKDSERKAKEARERAVKKKAEKKPEPKVEDKPMDMGKELEL